VIYVFPRDENKPQKLVINKSHRKWG